MNVVQVNKTRDLQFNVKTISALREFLQNAATFFANDLIESLGEWSEAFAWSRGSDGTFRKEAAKPRKRLTIHSYERLREVPGYDACVKYFDEDELIRLHLRTLVGIPGMACRIDEDLILWRMILSIFDESTTFFDSAVEKQIEMLFQFCASETFNYSVICPIPYLKSDIFPLQLSEESVLDNLTEDETRRCIGVGVLQPESPSYPIVDSKLAVGIRYNLKLPKIIGGNSSSVSLENCEGGFGRRTNYRPELIAEDFLSAFRLVKRSQLFCAGFVATSDEPFINFGISSKRIRQTSLATICELTSEDAKELKVLWNQLCANNTEVGFAVQRFNLAFERDHVDDRLVDLMICAESLFLGDGRDELSFRYALRAGLFVDHPNYEQREIFQIMRDAYELRSMIVHGKRNRKISKIRLPDKGNVPLEEFTNCVEEILRLALRKALVMDARREHRNKDFWEELVFSK